MFDERIIIRNNNHTKKYKFRDNSEAYSFVNKVACKVIEEITNNLISWVKSTNIENFELNPYFISIDLLDDSIWENKEKGIINRALELNMCYERLTYTIFKDRIRVYNIGGKIWGQEKDYENPNNTIVVTDARRPSFMFNKENGFDLTGQYSKFIDTSIVRPEIGNIVLFQKELEKAYKDFKSSR